MPEQYWEWRKDYKLRQEEPLPDLHVIILHGNITLKEQTGEWRPHTILSWYDRTERKVVALQTAIEKELSVFLRVRVNIVTRAIFS